MWKITLVILLAGTLFTPPSQSFGADEKELLRLYRQTSVALWRTSDATEPICAITYFMPEQISELFPGEVERSYLVSAGHCGGGFIRRSVHSWQEVTVLAIAITRYHDELIGTILDLRPSQTYFKKARLPHNDEVAYTTKAPIGADGVAELQKLIFVGWRDKLLVFRGEIPIVKGMSGSPVISEEGNLLGLVIRIIPEDEYLYEVVPVTAIMHLFSIVRTPAAP